MCPASSYQEAKQKLIEKSRTPEFQAQYRHYQSESLRLLKIAQSFLRENYSTLDIREMRAVRREFASGSTLHRGFYCPCPVFEIMVGNTHRGKILKRITSRSKPTHEYGFDANGQLLWAKTICGGKQIFVEHILCDGDRRYGITVDSSRMLHTITEEVFCGNRIVQYTNLLCRELDDSFPFREINSYQYFYDEQGLSIYVWDRFMAPCSLQPFMKTDPTRPSTPDHFDFVSSFPPMLTHEEFSFTRENGYIVSYSGNGRTYIPRVKKNAQSFFKIQ